MPELPEVETIKRQLSKKLVGMKIEDIEVRKPRMFKGKKSDVVGKKIEKIERRAKILVVKLSRGLFLIIHLKMSGQLVFVAKDGKTVTLGHPIPFAGTKLPGKTTHIIFSFDNGGRLFFNDLRQFGWVKVIKRRGKIDDIVGVKLGPEPFGKEFTVGYFGSICSRSKRAIKLVIMDQAKIAGVGNIYANEALFVAGILPTRGANSLKGEEVEKLQRTVKTVLKKGIEAKGASGADEAYIDTGGEKGKYKFLVYQRDGESCFNKCGGEIKRIKLGGRGTFYCSKCQR